LFIGDSRRYVKEALETSVSIGAPLGNVQRELVYRGL
jgi:hypothetical protein